MAAKKPDADLTADEVFEDSDTDLSKFDRPDLAPKAKATFTDEMLERLRTADDPLQALAEIAASLGQEIEDSAAVGSVFKMVNDKTVLVGNPFTVLDWRFCESNEYGGHFSAVRCLDNKSGELFVFTDGGSGIHDRLMAYYMREGRTGIISCEKGLSKSEYDRYEDEERTKPLIGDNGKVLRGTTYYFA
jgi:hypothetical protein